MGSSEVSLAALKILFALPEVAISTVWTNPPKPYGRKHILRPTPVAKYIATLDPNTAPQVIVTEKIGTQEINALRTQPPDAIIVAAFGHILPSLWLEIPPLGCYNLHFSLLPKYRGASPIQSAILNGEQETGITLQKVVFKLDAGDVVLSDTFSLLKDSLEPTNIAPALSATEAFAKSIFLSEPLLAELIGMLVQAKTNDTPVPAIPQKELTDDTGVVITPSYCHKFSKIDGLLPRHNSSLNNEYTTETAIAIYRRYLALDPWPGLYFIHEKISYTITGLTPIVKKDLPDLPNLYEKGVYLFSNAVKKRMFLWAKPEKENTDENTTTQELLEITSIKKAGKNVLSTKDFLNGCRWEFPLKLSDSEVIDNF